MHVFGVKLVNCYRIILCLRMEKWNGDEKMHTHKQARVIQNIVIWQNWSLLILFLENYELQRTTRRQNWSGKKRRQHISLFCFLSTQPTTALQLFYVVVADTFIPTIWVCDGILDFVLPYSISHGRLSRGLFIIHVTCWLEIQIQKIACFQLWKWL